MSNVGPNTPVEGAVGTARRAASGNAAVDTTKNVAQGANEKCSVAQWQGLRCWTFVGFVPIYGYCAGRGVCKASEVGNITGGFFNVGAQIVVGAFWGGVKNAFVGTPGGASRPSQPQCSTRYRVTVPSSDPCAVYIPPTPTSTLSTSEALLRALGALSTTTTAKPKTSVGNILLNMAENIIAPVANRTPIYEEITPIEPGSRGDIQLTATGATIRGESVDVSRNRGVSGFFGAKTLTEDPRSLVARMCIVRPWQDKQMAAIMSASIFDEICDSKGFKTGLPAAASASAAPKTSGNNNPASTASTSSTSSGQASSPQAATSTPVPYVKPAVAIWASPQSVQLGSRTTVIWQSKGVVSCIVSSPDGGFNDDRTSGRASTVSITGPTTFTISCLAPDGSHVTDFVRVSLAI